METAVTLFIITFAATNTDCPGLLTYPEAVAFCDRYEGFTFREA